MSIPDGKFLAPRTALIKGHWISDKAAIGPGLKIKSYPLNVELYKMAILPLQKRVKPRKKIYDLIIVITSLILNLFQKISPIRQVSELIKTFFNSALDNIPVSTFEWSLQGGQLLFTNLYISNNKLFSYVFVVVENSIVKVLCRSCSFDNW